MEKTPYKSLLEQGKKDGMKTRTHKILFGTACPNFKDWAETSDIPYEKEGEWDYISYIVNWHNVMHCKTPSPYLSELQQAFKNNPEIENITLEVI